MWRSMQGIGRARFVDHNHRKKMQNNMWYRGIVLRKIIKRRVLNDRIFKENEYDYF